MSHASQAACRRTAMVALAAFTLLAMAAPSTSARSGAGTLGVTLRKVGGSNRPNRQRTVWLSRSQRYPTSTGHGLSGDCGQSFPHKESCVAPAASDQAACTKECLGAESALASLRGGGSGDEASVFTLFVRVFSPKFNRDKFRQEGREADGLDIEGVGLLSRLHRLLSSVWRSIAGISGDREAKGAETNAGGKGRVVLTGKAKAKAKGKGNGATSSHLEKSYRPGNANYRIQKELKDFIANPPDNCKVSVGKNIRVWIITIRGAEGTIYAGEKFRLRVAFPEDYPTKPPAVYFLQAPPPPKHQHIYTNGDICLSLLSTRDWKPNLTVMSLALSILSMLSSAKEKRLPEDNAAQYLLRCVTAFGCGSTELLRRAIICLPLRGPPLPRYLRC